MRSNHFNPHCPDWATALLNGFSQVVLQRHPLCGLCCLLAILIGTPGLVGGALLGGLAGLLTAQRRGYPKAERQAGLYSYNGVLLGLLISLQGSWSVLLPLLITAAGGLSAILVRHWRVYAGERLPAYTAPFVLLGWALLAFAIPHRVAALPMPDISLVDLPRAALNGFGQIMFLADPMAGALIMTGLLLANRRAALWALLGSCTGLAFSLCTAPSLALAGLGGYSAALTALALSQQPWQPRLTLTGIVLTILLATGFNVLGLPPLTAPFVLACWLARAGARTLLPTRLAH
ncbi:urea transporter [Pseudomonas gingeri]|uniref:Urea transporter n=1 Tax=Pseudomonas gingeri TaxID=117681 RepID=A0A7Y7YF59_9PSED|nr:urea transporter [Pseudomonas gingeri]NWB29431.1 urea transporter [Pseudomonas gingeri]NWC35334.1 urea transporter [Pseudomonas gingeri]NWD07885.1 urea transporter [Pseudomonas gingeri]NWD47543.1 urea transporter [Pseudomonas gingeri]NWE32326.1 urea transporter [Pseudomonas gingeri]